ncbi:MAG: mechanosensitive ion channel family protein [Chloroflexota bacterium]|nr:mechanosensitive ion channel family protein [Chloroflexota bacterium]
MDFSGTFQELLQAALRFIPHLIAALVTFAASLLLSKLAARWVHRAAQQKISDPETLRLLSRLTHWSVLIMGTLVALGQINFDVTSFVAGLGVAGITIGFALQDIARNFVAGILLLIRQPFNIGDAVKMAGYAGTVLDITTRDTVLKTWDGETVILPNIEVFTSAITNYSELPLRRRTINIGLGYDEDVSQATSVFLDVIQSVEGVLEDPAPTLLAEELGDSALTLAARFWVNQETHGLFGVHSEVVRAIKEIAEKQEIDLPYPVQTVRLEGAWPASEAILSKFP